MATRLEKLIQKSSLARDPILSPTPGAGLRGIIDAFASRLDDKGLDRLVHCAMDCMTATRERRAR